MAASRRASFDQSRVRQRRSRRGTFRRPRCSSARRSGPSARGANALGSGAHRQSSAPLSAPQRAPSAGGAPPRAVDPDGLRAEAARVLSRATKRLDKARARAAACTQREAELFVDPAPFDADLMALPNRAELASAEASEAAREAALRQLVEIIAELDTSAHPRARLAIELRRERLSARTAAARAQAAKGPAREQGAATAVPHVHVRGWRRDPRRAHRAGERPARLRRRAPRRGQLLAARVRPPRPPRLARRGARVPARRRRAAARGGDERGDACGQGFEGQHGRRRRRRQHLPRASTFAVIRLQHHPDSERAGRSMVAVVVDRPMYASML